MTTKNRPNRSATTLLGRPRPPYLHEEFALGAPLLLNRVQRGLTHRERRYVLWARGENYSFRQIAADLHRPLWDLSRFVKKAEDDPGIFLDCGYVVKVESDRIGVADRWFCCKCGQAGTEEPGVAANHAWGHLFGDTDHFGR